MANMTREEFGEAYEHGFERTRRFLLSRGINKESAEEIAQHAWVKGLECLHQLKDKEILLTWINSIAIRHFLTVTTRGIESHFGKLDFDVQIEEDWTSFLDASLVLAKCTFKERKLLSEFHLQECSCAEMARQRGVSETAIRIKLLRLRRVLRKRFRNVAHKAKEGLAV